MNHSIGQNETRVVHVGDNVTNLATTICGLVLAFTDTSDEVACYHWPFMEYTDLRLKMLTEIMARIGPVSKIVVVTNDFQTEQEKSQNVSLVSRLKRFYGVKVAYFVVCDSWVEDITVLVRKGEVKIWAPSRKVDSLLVL